MCTWSVVGSVKKICFPELFFAASDQQSLAVHQVAYAYTQEQDLVSLLWVRNLQTHNPDSQR